MGGVWGRLRTRGSVVLLAAAAVLSLLAHLNRGVGLVPTAVSAGMPLVLVVAVLAALAGWPHAILGRVALLALVVVPQLGPIVDLGRQQPAQTPHHPLTVMSLNTFTGLADPHSVAQLAAGVDVLALHETSGSFTDELVRELGTGWEVAFDRLDDRVGGSTVVLVHAATAQLMTVSQLAAAPTPAAVLEIRKGGIPVRIIATRLSNPVFQASELWAQGVAALTGELGRSDLQTVVVGDFNATPWHVRYRAFTHDTGLTDCAVPAGATLTGTWRPTRRNWFPLAIDHALARGAKCSSYRVAAVPGSDHKAILVTVALS